jgi:lipopolysaccharide/colanic/teichoic acid biosynthesis glycosyltransferase
VTKMALVDTPSAVDIERLSLDREHQAELALVPAGSAAYGRTKRVLDVAFSALLLVLLAAPMLVIAVLVKLTSGGPVFFRQMRAGADGEPFEMVKFRTMYEGAEQDREYLAHRNEQSGPVFKIAEDPRITRLGRFLRRSSIDELPQLLNVLRGQMSIVGPRPLPLDEAQQAEGPARLRTTVKPGLTCLWQISGRNDLAYNEWVRLDLYYIRHRSTLLDLLIVVQTIPAVLTGRGAY